VAVCNGVRVRECRLPRVRGTARPVWVLAMGGGRELLSVCWKCSVLWNECWLLAAAGGSWLAAGCWLLAAPAPASCI
jgi:hypothetical protein